MFAILAGDPQFVLWFPNSDTVWAEPPDWEDDDDMSTLIYHGPKDEEQCLLGFEQHQYDFDVDINY